jgi:hypothetical protein
MKFIVSILVTAIFGYALALYLPWYSYAIAAFLVAAAFHQRGGRAFLSGFLSIGLLWGGLAWYLSAGNEHRLAKQVASILPLQGNEWALMALTAVLGGLVGGLAALSGSYLRARNSAS